MFVESNEIIHCEYERICGGEKVALQTFIKREDDSIILCALDIDWVYFPAVLQTNHHRYPKGKHPLYDSVE